jgi:hypothetical protein
MRQPVAACETCGKPAYDTAQINERCSSGRGKDRCRGVYGSRLNEGDWAECLACDATGRSAGLMCEVCQGSGFVDSRR